MFFFRLSYFLLPSLIFSPLIILGRGHFCQNSRQSGDDRKCASRRMGFLGRCVIMLGPGSWRPSGHASFYHHGSHIFGLFWRRSNKSVSAGCPSTPRGLGIKPLLTAVVEGGNHTCPDFLRGSKTSRAHFREVLELSKPTFHPVWKSPKQLPAAFGGHLWWGCHRELLIYYPQYTAAHIWCNL